MFTIWHANVYTQLHGFSDDLSGNSARNFLLGRHRKPSYCDTIITPFSHKEISSFHGKEKMMPLEKYFIGSITIPNVKQPVASRCITNFVL